jgi:drug/metabolite transporter (DMT)-like permease
VKTFGIVAGLAAAAIWGGMYVVSKVVLDVIPPFLLITSRLILGAACLVPLILLRGGFRIQRSQVLPVLGVGLIGYGISLGFQFLGTSLSTAANASLVTAASPVFILLFGAWILRERVTPWRVLALVLASAGVLAVIDPRQANLGGTLFLGNLSLLAASLTWGLYSVLVKKVSLQLGTLEVSLFAFLGGLPLTLALGIGEAVRVGVGEITPGVILGVLYLGVISTALAMYLWNKSLALLDAGVVSLLFFAQPVVGAGLGALLLGEQLGLGFWLGALLIACGLVVGSRAEARVPQGGSNARGEA